MPKFVLPKRFVDDPVNTVITQKVVLEAIVDDLIDWEDYDEGEEPGTTLKERVANIRRNIARAGADDWMDWVTDNVRVNMNTANPPGKRDWQPPAWAVGGGSPTVPPPRPFQETKPSMAQVRGVNELGEEVFEMIDTPLGFFFNDLRGAERAVKAFIEEFGTKEEQREARFKDKREELFFRIRDRVNPEAYFKWRELELQEEAEFSVAAIDWEEIQESTIREYTSCPRLLFFRGNETWLESKRRPELLEQLSPTTAEKIKRTKGLIPFKADELPAMDFFLLFGEGEMRFATKEKITDDATSDERGWAEEFVKMAKIALANKHLQNRWKKKQEEPAEEGAAVPLPRTASDEAAEKIVKVLEATGQVRQVGTHGDVVFAQTGVHRQEGTAEGGEMFGTRGAVGQEGTAEGGEMFGTRGAVGQEGATGGELQQQPEAPAEDIKQEIIKSDIKMPPKATALSQMSDGALAATVPVKKDGKADQRTKEFKELQKRGVSEGDINDMVARSSMTRTATTTTFSSPAPPAEEKEEKKVEDTKPPPPSSSVKGKGTKEDPFIVDPVTAKGSQKLRQRKVEVNDPAIEDLKAKLSQAKDPSLKPETLEADGEQGGPSPLQDGSREFPIDVDAPNEGEIGLKPKIRETPVEPTNPVNTLYGNTWRSGIAMRQRRRYYYPYQFVPRSGLKNVLPRRMHYKPIRLKID
jgi:hypothetical protein